MPGPPGPAGNLNTHWTVATFHFFFFFFHFHFHYHSGTVNHNTPPIQRPTGIICERTTVKQTHSLSGPAKWVNWKKIILRHN